MRYLYGKVACQLVKQGGLVLYRRLIPIIGAHCTLIFELKKNIKTIYKYCLSNIVYTYIAFTYCIKSYVVYYCMYSVEDSLKLNVLGQTSSTFVNSHLGFKI